MAAEGAGGIVSSRDFVNLRYCDAHEGSFVCAGKFFCFCYSCFIIAIIVFIPYHFLIIYFLLLLLLLLLSMLLFWKRIGLLVQQKRKLRAIELEGGLLLRFSRPFSEFGLK